MTFEEKIRARKAREAAGAAISGTTNGSPDQAAKAFELAPAAGVPPSVIRLDLEGWESRIKARKNAEIIQRNEPLQRFVTEDPLHAEAAAEEFDLLDVMSKSWERTKQAYQIGAQEAAASSALGHARAVAQTGMVSPYRVAELRGFARAATEAREKLPWSATGPRMLGGIIGGFSRDLAVGGAPGALAGSAAGGPAGAVAGFTGGTALAGAASSYGGVLDSLDQAEIETGQTINPYTKQAAALLVGGLSYGASFVGMKGPTQQALIGVAKEALLDAAKTPTFSRAVGKAGAELGKAGLVGGAGEALVAGGQGIVEDLAKTVSEGEWDTLFNDPDKRTQLRQQMTRAFVEGASMYGAFHTYGVGANLINDLALVRESRASADAHDQFVKGAGGSKMREVNPEAFKKFAQKVVGDRQVGIDPEVIQEAGAEQVVRDLVPDFDRQAEVALATGGAIQVPYADYLARIDPATDKLLREGIVWEPGGLSLRDAEGLEAWHGTPHEFNAFRFDETTFRTGEGAASYGAGLYFAENREVGENYRISTADDRSIEFSIGDERQTVPVYGARKDITDALGLGDTSGLVFRSALDMIGEGVDVQETIQNMRKSYQYLDPAEVEAGLTAFEKSSPILKGLGNLYRVKIKAKPEELLNWDKPLSEQPPEVLDKIRQAVADDPNASTITNRNIQEGDPTGDWVQSMGGFFKSDVELSRRLREAGIPGLRYLDQGSRATPVDIEQTKIDLKEAIEKGNLNYAELLQKDLDRYEELLNDPSKQTRNMVIFDDSRIEILDRNGEPLRGAEREAALAEYGQPEVTREPEQVEGQLAAKVTEPPVIEPALATPEGALAADVVREVAENTAKELWLQPMFKDNKALNMTQTEFKLYSRRLEEWANGVNEAALKAARREVSRRQTVDWEDTAAKFRSEVERELNLQKDFQAYEFLTKGRLVGEDIPVPPEAKVKLSAAAVADITDRPLPRGTVAKGGIDPDEVAPLFGYRTGEELVRDLANLEEGRDGRPMGQYRKALIEEETTQRTEEALGRLDENIEREAQETALQLAQQDLLAQDLAILGKEINAPPFEIEPVRDRMRERFENMPLREARQLKEFTRLVGKAGRQAELALLKGDIAKAFEQKQIQLMAHMMRVEAQKFSREVERAEKRFKRLGKKPSRPSIDQEYLDQAHGLLARHGYSVRRDTGELARTMDRTSLADFLEMDRDMTGGSIIVPRNLLGNQLIDPDARPVTYFRGFANAIKSIEHAGQAVKQITLAGEKIALDQVVGELTEKAKAHPRRFNGGVSGFSNALKHAVYSGDAILTQTKRFFDDLDDFDANGPFNRYIVRPLREATGKEKDLRAELSEKAKAIVAPKNPDKLVNQDLFREILVDGEPPMEMTRMDMVSVALNLGSAENTQKLIEGYFPETRGNVELYIDRRNQTLDLVNQVLNEDDWRYVEQVWKFFDGMWGRIEEAGRKRTGVAPKRKTASPIDTKFGRVNGGYYPIFYDPLRSRSTHETATFGPQYQGVETWHGYLEEVTNAAPEQIHLKEGHTLLPWRIRSMAHDLTMHDAILDVQKVLKDSRVQTELKRSIGPEYVDQFHPWLQSIANRHQNEAGLSKLAEFSRGMRGRLSIAVLGLNPTVLFTPSLGNLAKGLVRLSTHPIDTVHRLMLDGDMHRFAHENSPELRHWEEGYNRDLDDMFNRRTKTARWNEAMAWIGFAFPMKIERATGYLTWSSAYLRGLKDGLSEADAIAFAEKTLTDDFPRQNMMDLPPIMRGNEGWRLVTMFYHFFNFAYNRTRRTGKLVAAGTRKARAGNWQGARRNFGDAFTEFLSFIVINAGLGVLFGSTDFEEDDSVGEKVAKVGGGFAAGMIPLARDFYRLQQGKKDGIQHPVVRLADMIWNGGEEAVAVATGEEPSEKWVKHLVEAFATPLGVPAVGPGRMAQFLYDYHEGNQTPENFVEWYRGLTTGKAEKE